MAITPEPRQWSARRHARITGITGIAFVVVFVVLTSFTADRPGFDDSAVDLRVYFTDKGTLVHLLTWGGAAASIFLLLPFAAGLRSVLETTERSEQTWSRLMYTGAVVAVAIVNSGSAFWEVLTQGLAERASDDILLMLVRLDAVSFTVTLPWAFALFAAAGSVALVDAALVPRWIGGLGALSAVFQAAGGLWVFGEDDHGILAAVGIVGAVLMTLWILAVSVTIIRDRARTAALPVTA